MLYIKFRGVMIIAEAEYLCVSMRKIMIKYSLWRIFKKYKNLF
jgi:GTP cyclohydrolase I